MKSCAKIQESLKKVLSKYFEHIDKYEYFYFNNMNYAFKLASSLNEAAFSDNYINLLNNIEGKMVMEEEMAVVMNAEKDSGARESAILKEKGFMDSVSSVKDSGEFSFKIV